LFIDKNTKKFAGMVLTHGADALKNFLKSFFSCLFHRF